MSGIPYRGEAAERQAIDGPSWSQAAAVAQKARKTTADTCAIALQAEESGKDDVSLAREEADRAEKKAKDTKDLAK